MVCLSLQWSCIAQISSIKAFNIHHANLQQSRRLILCQMFVRALEEKLKENLKIEKKYIAEKIKTLAAVGMVLSVSFPPSKNNK